MKKFIALLLVILSVAAAIPALSACSSDVYIKYTLYSADGTEVETYNVPQDIEAAATLAQESGSVYEEPSISAEDGSYFVVTGYSGRPDAIVIPDTYGGIPVTGIAQQAFENVKTITSVTMGDNITSIGVACFLYCVRLQEVKLSASLTEISQSAFAYCSSLTSIEIPEGVTNIGYKSFYTCDALTSVTLPDSLVTISSGAFENCSAIENLVIPENVETIGSSAFLNNYAITSLVIPDCVTHIGYAAFQDCIGLTSVTIGSGVTYIGGYAFCYCTALTSINIPADVTYIGENAFCYDAALTNVYMDNLFSDGTEKMCYLYTVDLSEEEEDNEDYQSGDLVAGTDSAKTYLYTTYNYYSDHNGESAASEFAGYIPKGAFEDSEYMATLLTTTLAGNENLGSDSDITVYWYFVSA